VRPADAPEWVRRAARDAATSGSVDLEKDAPHDRSLRLHAERFTVDSGKSYVAVAVADRVELEDRYAALIGAFAGAAIVALVLVAGGGYVLVRKSTAPVEHTMESMRRFMADAAHELRTPITVLRSRAEVALQRPRDSISDAEALRGVERESERLSRIVDDLLILARADAGERQPRRERIYLDDIADDAASAARALAEPCGVTVAIETFEEAVVLGDPDLIRQLLMIVLDNAVKFTPPGGRVGIGISAPEGRALVEVRDTGIGIPPEQLPHVFERFYRGDPARARAPSAGAGLGLAIARWIADVHGATIDISSDVGCGTRVAIRFPLPG
jgi:signal transduction histidine kinase